MAIGQSKQVPPIVPVAKTAEEVPTAVLAPEAEGPPGAATAKEVPAAAPVPEAERAAVPEAKVPKARPGQSSASAPPALRAKTFEDVLIERQRKEKEALQAPGADAIAAPAASPSTPQGIFPSSMPPAHEIAALQSWAIRAFFAAKIAKFCAGQAQKIVVSVLSLNPTLREQCQSFEEAASIVNAAAEVVDLPPQFRKDDMLEDMRAFLDQCLGRAATASGTVGARPLDPTSPGTSASASNTERVQPLEPRPASPKNGALCSVCFVTNGSFFETSPSSDFYFDDFAWILKDANEGKTSPNKEVSKWDETFLFSEVLFG